jgi:hypothetical protein
MMTAKHTFSCASVLFLMASSIPALLGQDSDNAARNKETTVTGCLSKVAGQYQVKDDTTGSEMKVTGTSDLEQHAMNHTVKLTGNTAMEDGKTVFKASKVEHVSATCRPPNKEN